MESLKAIITEEDYNKAIKRLEVIFDANPETKKGEELDKLVSLIEKYEDKHYPINGFIGKK